ncbi:heterokaryon incompatibility protein-domain-containing protein [Chaetomium sp. MPI-CAGE-AT-0009]|nr:heterokaryon incompatibility protein-domain-containing protein [Chaetomium sp. MPI-CAGE-AT-0009]
MPWPASRRCVISAEKWDLSGVCRKEMLVPGLPLWVKMVFLEQKRPAYPDCYRHLSPGFIRVFELEPGYPNDPIVGRLVPQTIHSGDYEAVSYVWGNPLNRRDVRVDGATLSVTENLHGALTAFRHPPRQGHRQEDVSERTSQIELMGAIFATARRVLGWLGWEEGEEGRKHALDAIRFIHSFMDNPGAGLRDARILLLHHNVSVTGSASRLEVLSKEDQVLFENQATKWEAVKIFFEIEYFHRAWIVQELGLAREAILYTALRPRLPPEVGSPSTEYRDLELDAFLDYKGASLVTHLGLMSWEDGTAMCDFLTSMHWVRILGVTDARDRVYSMLGHPYATLDGVTLDLYVVSLVDHEHDPCEQPRKWDSRDEGRMPSWVPDWHAINRTTPMDWPEPAADAGARDIQIMGPAEGTQGGPLPHLLVKGWVVDEIVAVSRRMETTDFPVTNLIRERAKVNPFWLDRVWELVFPADHGLSLALPLGTREKGEPVSRTGSQQTRAEHMRSFAAYVLDYHELRQTVPDGDDSGGGYVPARSLYDSLPAEARAELRRRAAGASSGGFLECMIWPSMCRVVYRTASGHVGMGSRVTRPGDLVCRVPGSKVLMTLRRIEPEGGKMP